MILSTSFQPSCVGKAYTSQIPERWLPATEQRATNIDPRRPHRGLSGCMEPLRRAYQPHDCLTKTVAPYVDRRTYAEKHQRRSST